MSRQAASKRQRPSVQPAGERSVLHLTRLRNSLELSVATPRRPLATPEAGGGGGPSSARPALTSRLSFELASTHPEPAVAAAAAAVDVPARLAVGERVQHSSRGSGVVARHEAAPVYKVFVNFENGETHGYRQHSWVKLQVPAAIWFSKHDRGGDGVLDRAEYRELLRSIGTGHHKLHPKYVEYFAKLTDRDDDGVVTLEDFTLVYDKLVHFDQLLKAPRLRRPPAATAGGGGEQHEEALQASSRLKRDSKLVCPAVPTTSVDIDEQSFEVEARYADVEVIGEGAYGLVCMATDSADGGKGVAIKKVRPTSDVLQLRCCLRELAILQHFGVHEHPNLLGLRSVMRPPEGHLTGWRDLYLVTDLLDSDLHQVIKSDQELSDQHCRWFAWQLLRGLHALHAAGVIHRDLKPSNLLVDSNCDLRIADYGISRGLPMLLPTPPRQGDWGGEGNEGGGDGGEGGGGEAEDDEDDDVFTSYVVTRWYRCPELLCGNKRYGGAIDVWSAGCVIGDLLGRAPLFGGDSHMEMLCEIVSLLGTPNDAALSAIFDQRAVAFLRHIPLCKPQPWADVYPDASGAALNLLSKLLVFDPARRLTLPEALCHPWFASLHTAADLVPQPACPFNFELCDLNLDHFLLGGLDAVRAFNPDYPLRVSELQRFGVMHNRSVSDAATAAAAADRVDVPSRLSVGERVQHSSRGSGVVARHEAAPMHKVFVNFENGETHGYRQHSWVKLQVDGAFADAPQFPLPAEC